MTQSPDADLIDRLAGIAPGSPLDALRRERPVTRDHAQSCHDVIFRAAPGHGLSVSMRHALALRVARLHGAPALAAHYRRALEADGATPSVMTAAEADGEQGGDDTLAALLRHGDLLALRPLDARPAHLEALRAAGLSIADIVAASQVIGFVSYQARLLAGLELLAGHTPAQAGGTLPLIPEDLASAFTLDELDWRAWLAPLPMEEASADQRAVIKDAWPGAETSEFFTLLVREPDILRHRMKLLNGIMYAPRGLPRAERELGATLESRLNGCPYCAAAHGRLHAQLAKEDATIRAVFRQGADVRLAGRAAAVVDYAAQMTPTPVATRPDALAALREAGLSGTEILDLTQAVAIFAWANRLMQTLGEPVPPAQN